MVENKIEAIKQNITGNLLKNNPLKTIKSTMYELERVSEAVKFGIN